jgi:hypothetical protein
VGVVVKIDSLYNSPLPYAPNNGGNRLIILQDVQELNQKSHVDKYTMKDIHDIGRV